MEFLVQVIDIVLHLDRHLSLLVADYGLWVYGVLFAIVFCETGLVVTPFLPGDSLLFVAGAVAAAGGMDLWALMAVLVTAALCGDNVNYWIGRWLGPKVFHYERGRWFKREHLAKTHAFYERHGGKAIILARFVPIFRTYVPFVAGIGAMTYRRFLAFSVAGAFAWVGLLVPAGYLFGNLPVVKGNLSLVILGIIVLSVLPGIAEYLRQTRAR